MVVEQVDLRQHPLSGMSLIEASAGTGKTYTISHLYLRCLLETDYEVEQLLVVTFTNAATQELKGRIRKLIHQVWQYLADEDIEDHRFDTLFGEYRGRPDALFKLQKALINFDEAAVYSIHGFCQRILNRYPVETNSLIDQQIIADEKQLLVDAVQDYWRKHIINREIDRLQWILQSWKNPQGLLQDIQPLLGFERDLQQLSQQLAGQALRAQLQDLWQQLTQAWREHDELQDILLNSPALNKQRIQKNTVNRLFTELTELFQQPLPYDLPAKWEIITANKLAASVKKNCSDERLLHRFFTLAGQFADIHQQWLEQLQIEFLIEAATYVQTALDRAKSQAQNVSFNDLIKKVAAVINNDNPWLIEKINRQYPLAMVDEFQDTDQRQYQIFKTLYQGREDSGLIMIGDPKQAIYSFRGADVFTYQQAKQATARQYTLATNYRSSASYIDMVNALFQQQDDAFVFPRLISFEQATASDQVAGPLTEDGEDAAPLVCWLPPATDKPLAKNEASHFFAAVCAQQINDLLQRAELKIAGDPVQARDLAVLVKTGRQARLVKQYLAELGISSALVLRDSVFASDQAREISLLLEVIIEPANIPRLAGLLSSDLFGWDAAQIFQLQQDNQQLVVLLEQMRSYQQLWQDKGVLSMFFRLLSEHQVVQKNLAHIEGERRVTNWLHIMELLQQQAGQHASQSQALHWLQLQREQAELQQENDEHQLRLESDSDLVRIVTIHKSKGLEYPIVFLPFMWDVPGNRNRPNSYSYHDDQGYKRLMVYDETQRQRWRQENLAEQVRLFYVAMTRARYRCYLGWGHISGAGSSAIAHCLYPRAEDTDRYPLDLQAADRDSLRAPFAQINRQQQLVDIIEPELQPLVSAEASKQETSSLSALEFKRHIEQQWRISSYSQIATSGHSERTDRPDYDAVVELSAATDNIVMASGYTRYSFAKGAKAGSFLHDILEHQDFTRSIDIELIRQKSTEYGFDEAWLELIAGWIDEVLCCDLGGFSLADIDTTSRISEMEFYLSIGELRASQLNQLLQTNDYLQPHQHYSFADIRGFLKGFIDLVFEQDGRYFIADYKSNYLGSRPEDYDQARCRAAMYEHHYHLQYLIYSLALHRYLQQRLPGYDYAQHFGGVYYLFLRGMHADNSNNNGIFFHRPEPELIRQLEDMFD
ncbi:MAG: exodeoxyribonuclease V subunit beta [Gammaproteobacteria bacterium]|nr:exodeoxyribonuclease V subunit beta [Gammaproteobacteria bacterium]